MILGLAGGEEPVELDARGECYMRAGVEDVVFAFMRFASGLAAHLHLSWLDPHKERRITVVGSRRMATFDDMEIERKLTVYDKGFDERTDSWGEYIARSGALDEPADRADRAAAPRGRALRRVHPHAARSRARTAPAGCAWCACSRACRRQLDRQPPVSLRADPRAPGLHVGEGVTIAARASCSAPA